MQSPAGGDDQGEGIIPEQYQEWGFQDDEGSTYSYSSDNEGEGGPPDGGGGGGTILDLEAMPRMGSFEGAVSGSEDSPHPSAGSFALMDFVKEQQKLIQELRQENAVLMSQCKEELRAQILASLKEEAQGILEAFSSGVIQSVSTGAKLAAGVGGSWGKRAFMTGMTPIEEVQERVRCNKRERRWLEQQVASGIEASVRTAVGHDPLLQSPSTPSTTPEERPGTTAAAGARPGTSTLQRRPITVASSSWRGQGHENSSNRSNGNRANSRAERDKRVEKFVANSPLQPSFGQSGNTRRRPWTSQQCTTRRLQPVQELPPPGQPEAGAPPSPQEDAEDNNHSSPPPLNSRTVALLESTQRLLDDQSIQRARTAVAASRGDGARPGTSLATRRPSTTSVTASFASAPSKGRAANEPTGDAPRESYEDTPPEATPTTTPEGHGDHGHAAKRADSHGPAKAGQYLEAAASTFGAATIRTMSATTSPLRMTKMARSLGRRPSTSSVTGRPSSHTKLHRTTTLRNVGEMLPRKLGEDEWENEVARSILTLYASSVNTEVRERSMGKSFSVSNLLAEEDKGLSTTLITATSTMAKSVTQSLNLNRPNTTNNATPTTRSALSRRPATTANPPSPSPPRPVTSCPRITKSIGHSKLEVPRRHGKSTGFILIPRTPPTIWFSGTGTNRAEWSAVPGMTGKMLAELQALDEKGHFAKYLALVEALLVACLRSEGDGQVSRFLQALWRQLVVTTNNFAVRSIEVKRYPLALELLAKALSLCEQDTILDKRTAQELTAFLYDTYAFYYHRRGKQNAALLYAQRAMRIHARHESWAHVAACHLHSAVILAKLNRVPEGVRCMGQVLHLVETGKLEVGGQATQKIALVAVCYHNLTVLYISLRNLGEAFMCSQNGRRLARLSLSYTNRWIDQFERTHKVVLCELAAKFRYLDKVFQSNEQACMFGTLLTAVN